MLSNGMRFVLVAGVVWGLSASSAHAATATGQFNVSVTVQSECRLASTTDLAFGNVGVTTAVVTGTSTLGVQCTNSTPYNVGLGVGLGSGATITLRKMTAATGGATVEYALYRDSAFAQIWGETLGTNTVAGTGNGNVQNLTVHGRIPVQPAPAPGNYTDTVRVTITY